MEEKERAEQAKNDLFLEKIFQVRFVLPPPSLSNWKKHLNSLLCSAMGEDVDDSFPSVIRVYEEFISFSGDSNRGPTPRQLLLFVNDIVTLKLQWKAHFPVSVLAAYVISSKQYDLHAGLQSGSVPTPELKRILSSASSLRDDFAVLYFNIDDTKKALNLLLKPVIEGYLRDGEYNDLNRLLMTDQSSQDVLDSLLRSSFPAWASTGPKNFFNALIALASSPPTKEDNSLDGTILHGHVSQLFLSNLKNAYRSFDALPIGISNCSAATIVAMKYFESDSEFKEIVLNSLLKFSQLSQEVPEKNIDYLPTDNFYAWANSLLEISSYGPIRKVLSEENFAPVILPLSCDDWVQFCDCFGKEENLWMLEVFNHAFEWDAFALLLRERITKNNFEFGCRIAFSLELNRGTAKEHVSLIFDALKERVARDPNLDLPSLENIFKTANAFCIRHAEISDFLSAGVADGWIYHLFFRASQENHFSLAAELAITILRYRPDLSNNVGFGNSDSGMSILRTWLTSPQTISEEQAILIKESLVEVPAREILVNLVLKNSNASEFARNMFERMSPEEKTGVLSELNYGDGFDADVEKFVGRLYSDEKSKKLKEAITDIAISEKGMLARLRLSNFSNCPNWLQLLALTGKGGEDHEFISRLKELLQNRSDQEWLEDIETFTWITSIAKEMVQKDPEFKLGVAFRKALLLSGREAIAGGSIIDTEHMHALFSLLPDTQAIGLGEDLYELIAVPDVQIGENFWNCFDSIIKMLLLRSGHQIRPVRRLLLPVLEKRDITGLRFLIDVFKNPTHKMGKDEDIALQDSVTEIAKIIEDSQSTDEMKELANELQSIIGELFPILQSSRSLN